MHVHAGSSALGNIQLIGMDIFKVFNKSMSKEIIKYLLSLWDREFT